MSSSKKNPEIKTFFDGTNWSEYYVEVQCVLNSYEVSYGNYNLWDIAELTIILLQMPLMISCVYFQKYNQKLKPC